MDEWEAVRLVVDGIKECRDYNAPDLKIDVMVPSECKDDEIPWYLSVPIEELSLLPNGIAGCTPEGLLKKTIGMSREDLLKQIY